MIYVLVPITSNHTQVDKGLTLKQSLGKCEARLQLINWLFQGGSIFHIVAKENKVNYAILNDVMNCKKQRAQAQGNVTHNIWSSSIVLRVGRVPLNLLLDRSLQATRTRSTTQTSGILCLKFGVFSLSISTRTSITGMELIK